MAEFRISEEYKELLSIISKLPSELRDRINSTLLASRPSREIHSVAFGIANLLGLRPNFSLSLIQFYTWLFQAALVHGKEKVLEDFRIFLNSVYPSNWDTFWSDLRKLLDSQDFISLLRHARANDIVSDTDRVFGLAKVTTGLLPFRFGNESLTAAVFHELRVVHFHNGEEESFYVSMTEQDIDQFIGTLRTAQTFGKELVATVNGGALKVLTEEDNSNAN